MYTESEMLVNIIITKKSYQKYLFRTTIVVFVKGLFYQKKNCTHLLELVHNVISSFRKILFCIIKYSQYLLWCN